MVGMYVPLEAYLTDHNVGRAIEMDEPPLTQAAAHVGEDDDDDDSTGDAGAGGGGGGQAPTVVDEVFYSLQTALNRAMAFADESAISGVLNHVMNVIEGDYRLYLASSLDNHRRTALGAVGQ